MNNNVNTYELPKLATEYTTVTTWDYKVDELERRINVLEKLVNPKPYKKSYTTKSFGTKHIHFSYFKHSKKIVLWINAKYINGRIAIGKYIEEK